MSHPASRLWWRFIFLLGIAVVLAVWSKSRERKTPGSPTAHETPAAAVQPASPASPAAVTKTDQTPPPTLMPVAAELNEALTRRDDPTENIRAVEQIIGFYHRALGENPVGQNEDITAAILGENPHRAVFLPADSPAIRDGKLIDAWGTPYWFHPISSRLMEVRSAGPDRELFTSDDLTLE